MGESNNHCLSWRNYREPFSDSIVTPARFRRILLRLVLVAIGGTALGLVAWLAVMLERER